MKKVGSLTTYSWWTFDKFTRTSILKAVHEPKYVCIYLKTSTKIVAYKLMKLPRDSS